MKNYPRAKAQSHRRAHLSELTECYAHGLHISRTPVSATECSHKVKGNGRRRGARREQSRCRDPEET